MPGKLLVIAEAKGGTGKSTVSEILANLLYFIKRKAVLLFDTDQPQYTVLDRYEEYANNGAKAIDPAAGSGSTLYPVKALSPKNIEEYKERIQEARAEYEYVIIDTPPRFAGKDRDFVFTEADLLIIPITASARAVTANWKWIASFYEDIPNGKIFFVRNLWRRWRGDIGRIRERNLEAQLLEAGFNYGRNPIPQSDYYEEFDISEPITKPEPLGLLEEILKQIKSNGSR